MTSPKQRARMERKRYKRLRRFIRRNLGQATLDSWLPCVRGYSPADAERLFIHWLCHYVHYTTVTHAALGGWR